MSTKKLQIIGGSILQPDWNQTDPNEASYIKGRPNIPSDFDGSYGKLTGLPDLSKLQNKSVISNVTIRADAWAGDGPYSQNLDVDGITANSKIDIQADSDTISTILSNGHCLSIKNDNGVATIYSIGSKPTTDIIIQLNIVEVAKSNPSDIVWGNPLIGSGGGFTVSTTEPTNKNALWIDTANGLKYYNGTAWVVVPVAYS